MIDSWHKYCQKQMRDSFHMLDEKLIFSNTPTNKKDYASKRLNYPLEEGTTDAWNKLMSTIYSEEERTKIEWAIGSIVCGESKKLQKFMVLYGAAGTGKSTVLNIIQQLFEDITRSLTLRHWVHPVTPLHWRHSRRIRLWRFSMMVICLVLRITLD